MIWIKKTLALAVAALALVACGHEGGGGSSAQGRAVEHAMGETRVRGTPERVVVLDTGELDSAGSLGVTPVGAVEAVDGLGLSSYPEGTGGIENVGTIEEPNLEKIATLNPDLILSSKLRRARLRPRPVPRETRTAAAACPTTSSPRGGPAAASVPTISVPRSAPAVPPAASPALPIAVAHASTRSVRRRLSSGPGCLSVLIVTLLSLFCRFVRPFRRRPAARAPRPGRRAPRPPR